MVQIRNVPDELHATLRRRAKAAGTSLSEYLLRELRDLAASPSLDEVLDDAGRNARAKFGFTDVVDALQDARRAR